MTWTEEEITSVNSILIPKGRERQRPVELPPSPHGITSNGAADYREFPLTCATSVVISCADFTESRSSANRDGIDQIMLTYVQCAHVVFDRARVFHRIDGRFDNCSFQRIGTDRCGL